MRESPREASILSIAKDLAVYFRGKILRRVSLLRMTVAGKSFRNLLA